MFSKQELDTIISGLNKLEEAGTTPEVKNLLRKVETKYSQTQDQEIPRTSFSFSPDEVFMLALITNITFCRALDDSRLVDEKINGNVTEDPLLILNSLHKQAVEAWVKYKQHIRTHQYQHPGFEMSDTLHSLINGGTFEVI